MQTKRNRTSLTALVRRAVRRDPTLAQALRGAIEQGLAGTSGVLLWDGMNGQLKPEPAEGWVLEIRWAVSDRSTEEWFEKERDALAELVKLANHHDRVVEGRYVNLTSPGCHDSTARVRPARGVA